MTRVGALIMFAAGVVVSFLLSQKIQKICANRHLRQCRCHNPRSAHASYLGPHYDHLSHDFAASFQWGTFSEAQGYASATIFLSNNTKQSVLAWTQFS